MSGIWEILTLTGLQNPSEILDDSLEIDGLFSPIGLLPMHDSGF